MSDSETSLDPRATLEVQNVVASSRIDQELDLQSVAMDFHGADYDPEHFPGLIYRVEEPRGTVLLFRSGKIVATGIESSEAVERVLATVFAELGDLGLDVPTEPAITIQNIVADADFGQQLNLNAIAIGLGLDIVEYEPEQFPGLVYRVEDPSVVLLLFGSGKLVVTGATTREEAEHAIDVVESRLDDLGLLA
jgi:transcription initiation factor TFIID TATA-box-binding protein